VAAELVLLSPLDGWAAPLAEVPDPVFAQAMMGDGAAIDPTGSVLHAPCDAVVASLHASRHAVGLRAAGGLELLLHIGLETVALNGEGFTVQVAQGQQVRAGDPLISFDLDLLARRAKSLISPMVITTLGDWAITARVSGRRVAVGDPLFELTRAAPGAAATPTQPAPELTRRIAVPLPHGLHARPAARVAECAGRFRAESALTRAGRRASARSPMALMSLGLQQGDEAMLSASGPDAAAALDALAALIEGGMGETAAPSPVAAAPAPAPLPAIAGLLKGVTAAPGLAIGRAVHLVREEIAVPEDGGGVAVEEAALAAALAVVGGQIGEALKRDPDAARRGILAAHLALLDDPELAAEARRRIGEGRSAGFAWRAAIGGFAEALSALADRRMAERVADLRDLERRVLAVLAGGEAAEPEIPPGAILLADEILPSQLMAIAPDRLAGLCTAGGGPTSHVAILAAAMGLPAVVAAGAGIAAIGDGATLILDADAGTLHTAPDARALEAAQHRLAERAERRIATRAAACAPSRLADGAPLPVLANLGSLAEAQAALGAGAERAERRIATRAAACAPSRLADGAPLPVLANLGSLAEAQAALGAGAEGSGLLRTEFLFLDRETPPDEDEQAERYQAIADALEGRPLVIRLFDIGGDKAAPYLPMAAEENPALGVRGVRLALRHPGLLRTQLRAVLRVAPPGSCSLMVPMVSRLSELRAVRSALDEARRDLGVAGPIELGVMVETPAAAMIADQLAAEADFLSIGTNDLTQYTLAMDRGNPELAAEIDGLEPAVLRLIAQTCEGGRRHGREIGVCGALAGDLAAIPILVGLGIGRLSMATAAIPEAKALIRTLSPDACRALAAQALEQPSAAAVRALAKTFQTGGG
jgi:phosphotransferase system HPr (HPr) family protein